MLNKLKNAVWTKVRQLKAGAIIAIEKDGQLDWDEIVSIKKVGREQVYDIEVEGTHNFVANNIIAHNTEQLRLRYDVSNYNSFTVGSTGSLAIAATGTNPNITLTPGGTGYTILNGNVGIGTTNPSAKLQVAGDILPVTDLVSSLGSGTLTWGNLYVTSILDQTGTEAISPSSRWLTGGNWNVSTGGLRIGDTTALTGGWKLYVSGNATVSGTLQTGGGLTVAGGSGKIDVGEIDPPYTINGDKYATYMTAMVGIKEEIAGHITTTANDLVEGVGFRTLIDLDQQPNGSDLWLFSKIVDINSHISDLSVLLTPEGQAKVWYEIDKTNKILAIYSSTPTNITYRLTAPRFDHDRLKTTRPADGVLGIVINNPSVYTNINSIFDNPATSPELIAKLDGSFSLKINGKENAEVSSFLTSIIGNLKVGIAVVANLVADNLTVRTKLISPLADIDQLRVIDATISGTLYADNIKGQTVDTLHAQINLLDEKYSTAAAILADLQARYGTYGSLQSTSSADLLALSPLASSSAEIPQDLFANTLSSFDTDLFIEPIGDKPVHLLANLMTLYPDGKVRVNGDLLVTGVIIAQGLETQTATVSGIFISADTGTNATVGTATIASGSAELTISNTNVTPSTLIYITPTSDTNGRVLFVKSKTEGVGFTVGLTESAATSSASFNYWLVETK